MVLHQKLSQSWELLFHHVGVSGLGTELKTEQTQWPCEVLGRGDTRLWYTVITCFGLSVLSCRFVGFAVVALLVEINSVFLHLRQMLRMADLASGTHYRLNSIVNLGTYVVFRINTLAWMTRWLVLNRDNVPLVSYTVGSVGMAIMTAMNIVLFCRLLRSDFLKSGAREGKKEKEM
ncbi:TLC domain-containing protein 2 [Merluccius polli]|uniref:TLC domain-containing protein 2 n=1 Tax=Merluccius polli TaxID=89951 RepID=A0AA47NLD6_MERPO|nr:TLC domain-containing protein 2 [Merluccius polli]